MAAKLPVSHGQGRTAATLLLGASQPGVLGSWFSGDRGHQDKGEATTDGGARDGSTVVVVVASAQADS